VYTDNFVAEIAMNSFEKDTKDNKLIAVTLPLRGIEIIIELLEVESEAWEYTVRYRQTGMPEEGLMTRDTNTTKNAQRMASFLRKLTRQLRRAIKLNTE